MSDFFKNWGAKFTDDEGMFQGGKQGRVFGRVRDKYDEYKASKEYEIGNESTNELLKDTEADYSYEAPQSGARKSFFESMDNPLTIQGPKIGKSLNTKFKGLGIVQDKLNTIANNPYLKEANKFHNINKNYGIGGYIGQALFNQISPNLNMNLTGSLPSLNWSPADNLNLSVRPDIKTDSGYAGINISGKYTF